MTTFPGSPRLLKGAIIGIDPFNSVASAAIFQYNPHQLSRTLTPQTMSGEGSPRESLRLAGPPQETISVEIEVDAADQLERGTFPATEMGVYPALSALETLIYPKSSLVIANEVLLAAGIIEVIPPEAPLTLFIWGIKRILPVRLTQLTITEEAFDSNLNPIRATVSLGLQVLNYQGLGLLSVGGSLFMAHQIVKEVMATLNAASNLPSASASFSFDANISLG